MTKPHKFSRVMREKRVPIGKMGTGYIGMFPKKKLSKKQKRERLIVFTG